MEVAFLEMPAGFWFPDTNSIAGSAGEKIEQATIPEMFHKMQNSSKNASPLAYFPLCECNVCMYMHVWRGVGVHIYLIDECFVIACP